MRLRDIDPEATARQVVEWISAHLTAVGMALSPSVEVRATDLSGEPRGLTGAAWRNTDAGRAAYVLAVYAQSGQVPDDAPVAEYMLSLGQALWSAPHPGVFAAVPYPWGDGAGEPVEAVDVILCAVQARETMATEERVSVRELAALASIGEHSLRRVSSRGDGPRVDGGSVDCGEARRWLSGRGVAGV